MRKGDRFIFVKTNEEIDFVKKDGIEWIFKYLNRNGRKPFLALICGNPISAKFIIPKP